MEWCFNYLSAKCHLFGSRLFLTEKDVRGIYYSDNIWGNSCFFQKKKGLDLKKPLRGLAKVRELNYICSENSLINY
jgi:hypothetical protein